MLEPVATGLGRAVERVGWDYDAWAWYDVGHDPDRRDRRDRGNLSCIYSALLSWEDPYGLSSH